MIKSNKMKLSFTNLERIYVVFIFVIIIIIIIIIIKIIIIVMLIVINSINNKPRHDQSGDNVRENISGHGLSLTLFVLSENCNVCFYSY